MNKSQLQLQALPGQIRWLLLISLAAVLCPLGGYFFYLHSFEVRARVTQGRLLASVNLSHDAMTAIDELLVLRAGRMAEGAQGGLLSRRERSLLNRLETSVEQFVDIPLVSTSDELFSLNRRLRQQLAGVRLLGDTSDPAGIMRLRLESVRLTLDQGRLLLSEASEQERRRIEAEERTAFVLLLPLLAGFLAVGGVSCWRIFASITAALQRKRETLAALASSEENLRQMIRHAPYCIHELDAAGRFTAINPAGLAMLRLDSDKALLGGEFLSVVRDADREATGALLEQALGGAGAQFEFNSVNERRFLCTLVPLAASGGEMRLLGMGMDITERVQAEETVRRSLHEKEVLLREIHHRVKNNLQTISSLLYFQSKKLNDPAAGKVFQEARERLASMVLVHEKLYSSSSLAAIDFDDYVRSLVDQIAGTTAVLGRRIQFRVEAVPVKLAIEAALPTGMILVELLTNVLKYAFPDGRQGTALIRLSQEEGHVRLEVQDNGVGLPPGFDPATTSSFGWQLIGNLTSQLGGVASIDREGGTRVTITYPYMSVL